MSDPYGSLKAQDKERKVGQKMTTLNNIIASGYNSWSHVPQYYNDYNVAGNDPTCKHLTWTDKWGVSTRQPYFNRYCDTCGYRKLFVKYAKYCRTTKKGK